MIFNMALILASFLQLLESKFYADFHPGNDTASEKSKKSIFRNIVKSINNDDHILRARCHKTENDLIDCTLYHEADALLGVDYQADQLSDRLDEILSGTITRTYALDAWTVFDLGGKRRSSPKTIKKLAKRLLTHMVGKLGLNRFVISSKFDCHHTGSNVMLHVELFLTNDRELSVANQTQLHHALKRSQQLITICPHYRISRRRFSGHICRAPSNRVVKKIGNIKNHTMHETMQRGIDSAKIPSKEETLFKLDSKKRMFVVKFKRDVTTEHLVVLQRKLTIIHYVTNFVAKTLKDVADILTPRTEVI